MTETSDTRLKKLKFRAWRRGFREADLILGPFADQHVQGFSDDELDTFERLLDQPDQDLYAWLLGREPVPPEHDSEIFQRIKAFSLVAHPKGGPVHGG
jgi:antitoxin CptB